MSSGYDSKDTLNTSSNRRSIGHYTLGATIGEGTFGKVRLGTHLLTGEKVAIKILEKKKIIDASDVDRVSREIHILKITRHPHIIQLYEIIETSSQLYLITEYASGGELFDHIVSCSRVCEREACKFFQQMISGVEYLHKIGVVHRDLKPENLLLDYANNIKMVDFGLSNIYRTGEKLRTACGSPCYAAPEMIAGKKYVGIQVDIWSAGIVLFALVCGYLPFEDPDTTRLYSKILKGMYVMPKFVSESFKGLVRGMLNTDPNKRFTISDIRNHPWYCLSTPKKAEGIVIGLNQIPIDAEIIKETANYGFSPEIVRKCVQANKHNHATTTYYLLLGKRLRESGLPSTCMYPEENKEKDKVKNQLTIKIKENLAKLLPKPPNVPKNPEVSLYPHTKRSLIQEGKVYTPISKPNNTNKPSINLTHLSPTIRAPLPSFVRAKFLHGKRGSVNPPVTVCQRRPTGTLNNSLVLNTPVETPKERILDQHITMIRPKINHLTIINAGNVGANSRVKEIRKRHVRQSSIDYNKKNQRGLNDSEDSKGGKAAIKKKLIEIYIPKEKKPRHNFTCLYG